MLELFKKNDWSKKNLVQNDVIEDNETHKHCKSWMFCVCRCYDSMELKKAPDFFNCVTYLFKLFFKETLIKHGDVTLN